MATIVRPVGEQLREWRQQRRMSQLELALEADTSSRHVSFLETGRAKPSREMLLRLADRLDVPLRDRNSLLLGAGLAPMYLHTPYDDPMFANVRSSIEQLLAAHEPFPAVAVDRRWNMLAANKGISQLIGDVDPALIEPPINVLRLSLHPSGMANRILNLQQWRAHVLDRLRHQWSATADPALRDLSDELAAYTYPEQHELSGSSGTEIAVPLRIATSAGTLSFLSTTTVFGTPTNVTLAEIALETFLPADQETAAILRGSGERLL